VSWTAEAKHDAVLRAVLGAHLPRPGLTVIERPGWYQVVTPSSANAVNNEVILSALSNDEVERVIDETIAGYRAHGAAFKWCVGPWSAPDDLGERLSRRGFRSWAARGMACEPAAIAIAVPADVTTELVTEASLALHVEALIRGWAHAASDADLLLGAHRERLRRGESTLFNAWRRGEIAGTAGFLRKPDGSAYLAGAQVFDAHRGRGAYRALLEARLARLRELGVSLATTHAREQSSAPILERLGFETVFRYCVYQIDPPNPKPTLAQKSVRSGRRGPAPHDSE
jgi:GNAT superfamily N-acetyltransferase